MRYVVRTGRTWPYLPDDLRQLLRLHSERPATPGVVMLDSRTLPSTPESGHRAGYDGAKRRKGRKVKVHVAVDTLGHLLAAVSTPTHEKDWAQIEVLAQEVQAAAGQQVSLAYVDQGYSGDTPAEAAVN